MKKHCVLCILDGWGNGNNSDSNAIFSAKTPCFNHLIGNYPSCSLKTCGPAVGLPENQMGNSEVGHMTIGLGKILEQDLNRINQEITNLSKNQDLQRFCKKLLKDNRKCHIMGLISDGGVHGHVEHLLSIVRSVSQCNIPVVIHAITDGRDTLPMSAGSYMLNLLSEIQNMNNVEIVTVSGRYYTMDRNKHLERTQRAFDAVYNGTGKNFTDPLDAITSYYESNIMDEFIIPSVINNYTGVNKDDGFIITNFRIDRIKQFMKLLYEKNKNIITMVQYSEEYDCSVLFKKNSSDCTLGSVLAKSGLRQLRVAETEKYPHVTYFFNAMSEVIYINEDREIIPSQPVSTYDLAPEMSANEITEYVVENMLNYDFILVNFANPDMVGHSGNFDATVKAVECVDTCLQRLYTVAKENNVILLVTADHGNADCMIDESSGLPHTYHTLNDVPFIIVGETDIKLQNGGLSNIAATVLQLLDCDTKNDFDVSLIEKQ